MNPLHFATAAAFLAMHLPAQLAPQDRLVGWVSSPLLPSSGRILQQDLAACTAATSVCNAALLNTTSATAGGAAYDPRRRALWICDDRTLELIRLADCASLCQTTPQRMSGLTISGLSISDRRQLMFQLETAPGVAQLETYDLRSCPPGQAALRPCSVPIAANATAAGLAFDEARQLLYVVDSERLLGGYRHTLHVLALASTAPCGQYVCTVTFADCSPSLSGMPITGLGYDCCTRILYATNGVETRSLRMLDPLQCSIQDLGCCSMQAGGGLYMGIDVVAGWTRTDLGQSCLGASCASCPGVQADLAGDPSLGNQEFALLLEHAPAGGFGLALLGLGSCTGGVQVPSWCGPLFPPASPLAFFLVGLTGSGCAASGTLPLPVPVDTGLCGLPVCSQWLVLCSGGGTGVSNAVAFTLAGS